MPAGTNLRRDKLAAIVAGVEQAQTRLHNELPLVPLGLIEPASAPADADNRHLFWSLALGTWRPWAGLIRARRAGAAGFIVDSGYERLAIARQLGWPHVLLALGPEANALAEAMVTRFLPDSEVAVVLAFAELSGFGLREVAAELGLPTESVLRARRLLERFPASLVASVQSASDIAALEQLATLRPASLRITFGQTALRHHWSLRRALAFRQLAHKELTRLIHGHPMTLIHGEEPLAVPLGHYLILAATEAAHEVAEHGMAAGHLRSFRALAGEAAIARVTNWQADLKTWAEERLTSADHQRLNGSGLEHTSIIEQRFEAVMSKWRETADRPSVKRPLTAAGEVLLKPGFQIARTDTVVASSPPSGHEAAAWVESAIAWWMDVLRPLQPWGGLLPSLGTSIRGEGWRVAQGSSWFRLEAARRLGWPTIYLTDCRDAGVIRGVPAHHGQLAHAMQLARKRDSLEHVPDTVLQAWRMAEDQVPCALGLQSKWFASILDALHRYELPVRTGIYQRDGLVLPLGQLAKTLPSWVDPALISISSDIAPDCDRLINSVARLMLVHRWPAARAHPFVHELRLRCGHMLAAPALDLEQRFAVLLDGVVPSTSEPWCHPGAAAAALLWRPTVWIVACPPGLHDVLTRALDFFEGLAGILLGSLPEESADLTRMKALGPSLRSLARGLDRDRRTVRRRLALAGL